MQNFPGKIGFPGDKSSDVTAVMSVSDTRLEITAGESSIGDWPIDGLVLELGARGYIVTLDGEQMILAPHDRFGFRDAVGTAQEAASQNMGRRQARKAAKSDKSAAKSAAKSASKSVAEPSAPEPSSHDVLEEPPPKTRNRRRATPPKVKKSKRQKKTKPPKDAELQPKAVPHVPGLEDPDKDAVWAHQSTKEPTSFRERLNTKIGTRNLVLAGVAAFLVLSFFAPAVVSFLLLVPGVVAVVLAGLSLLDPAYTRLLPASLSEIRLMMLGLAFFAASLLVATIF